MEFTEEEKRVFSEYDKSLSNPSYYLEDGVLGAYDYNERNYRQVEVTYSFIKKMLVEVAKIKGYDIDPDIKNDVDELLDNELESPKHLQGFDNKLYKYPEKLRNYIANEIKNMNYEEIENVMDEIHFNNIDLNGLMSRNIPNLLSHIVELNGIIESSKEENIDDFVVNNQSAINYDEFPDDDLGGTFFDPNDIEEDPFESIRRDDSNEKKELDEEDVKNMLMFVNSVIEIAKCKSTCSDVFSKLRLIKDEKKLEDFHSDEEFMSRLTTVMEHDPGERVFYYHGTQCLEDAESIIVQGLGMHQENLSSTAYSEFTPDELLLYSRGLSGEVGRSAIVIFEGKRGDNIVENLEDKSSVNFNPSGLQGLNVEAEYVVKPKHIVGYVDKINKKVVLNPQYELYDELEERLSKEKNNKIIND